MTASRVSTRALGRPALSECNSLVTVRNSEYVSETDKQKLSFSVYGKSLSGRGNLHADANKLSKKFKPTKHSPTSLRILFWKSQKLLSIAEQQRPSNMRDGYCEEVISDFAVNVSRGEDGIYFTNAHKEEVRCLVVISLP
jgi:hypothetical protein